MVRRMLIIAGVLVAFLAAPAFGQYVDNTAQVNNPNPNPGSTVVVTGTCAAGPNTPVTIKLDNAATVGTGTTGADGTYSVSVTIPANTSLGAHTLNVFCGDVPIAVLPINVTAKTTGTTGTTGTTAKPAATTGTTGTTGVTNSTSPLARTGSNLAPVLTVGAVLLAAGGLLMLTTRKRRHSGTAA